MLFCLGKSVKNYSKGVSRRVSLSSKLIVVVVIIKLCAAALVRQKRAFKKSIKKYSLVSPLGDLAPASHHVIIITDTPNVRAR